MSLLTLLILMDSPLHIDQLVWDSPFFFRLLSVLMRWFCYCLFIVYSCSNCLMEFCLGPCIEYIVSFLYLQSFHWGRKNWLLLLSSDGMWTVAVVVICLFLSVPWACLWSVNVAFTGLPTYFLRGHRSK